MHTCFFVGSGTQDICSLPFNKYSFFLSFVSLLVYFALFFMNCINSLAAWPNLNPSWIAVELISSNWVDVASWATLLGLNGLLGCIA